jgi:hypothetical protein
MIMGPNPSSTSQIQAQMAAQTQNNAALRCGTVAVEKGRLRVGVGLGCSGVKYGE